MNQLETAQLCSTGQFSQARNQCSAQIVWKIIGQQPLDGIREVTQHCLSMQRYFDKTKHFLNQQCHPKSKYLHNTRHCAVHCRTVSHRYQRMRYLHIQPQS